MPVNPEGIRHLLSWEGDVGQTYAHRIDLFVEAAKINAPFRPDNPGPHLIDAIEAVRVPHAEGLEVLIGTHPNEHIQGYSEIVQEGSRPHEIRPRPPKRFLKFKVAGRTIYAHRVMHPGTSPDPFLMNLIHLIIK